MPRADELFRRRSEIPTELFLKLFRGGANSARETPDELPEPLRRGAELLRRERPPWEAEIPLDLLARAQIPALIISGDHSPAFEAVCNTLAGSLGGERARIPGRGHTVPSTGEPYNRRLTEFLSSMAA